MHRSHFKAIFISNKHRENEALELVKTTGARNGGVFIWYKMLMGISGQGEPKMKDRGKAEAFCREPYLNFVLGHIQE